MYLQATEIIAKKWFYPVVVGVVSAAGAGTTGYFVGKRRGVVQFLDQVNERLHEAEETEPDPQMTIYDIDPNIYDVDPNELHLVTTVDEVNFTRAADVDYSRLLHPAGVDIPGEDVVDINEPAEDVIAVDIPEDAGEPVVLETFVRHPDPEPVHDNIFDNPAAAGWDLEAELAAREGAEFYIITTEEFVANETEYHQETMTYYAGDDIMADEDDKPIYAYHNMMGELKFGHGTNDRNAVYIRNDALRKEWEILKLPGQFAVEVRGMQIEDDFEASDLKHSALRKFRVSD